MLYIDILDTEIFNEYTQEFEKINGCTLCLEHSLVSISKWESKWHKSFINTKDKTDVELIDYIKCMTITQNVDPKLYVILSNDNIIKINEYIGDSRSATTFMDRRPEGASKKTEVITSELIYYWLVAYQIPFECQRWHLNRLLTLIRICSIKNDTGKDSKMSKRAILSNNRALNQARRQSLNSKG